MPSPSTSLATLRPELGGSMEAFDLAADRAGFIGLKLLPVFEAAEQSGSFGKIPLEELLKNRDTERAPGGSNFPLRSGGQWRRAYASVR